MSQPPRSPISRNEYITRLAILGGLAAPVLSCMLIAFLTMGMGESLAFSSVFPSVIIGVIAGASYASLSYNRMVRAHEQMEAAHKKEVEKWRNASADGLVRFMRQIEGARLDKTAEEYYTNGKNLVMKSQFDDAILEFTKVIRISDPEEEWFSLAKSELKGMGFSEEDINRVRST